MVSDDYWNVELRGFLNKNIKSSDIWVYWYSSKNRLQYRKYCKKYKKFLINMIIEFKMSNNEACRIANDYGLDLEELKIYYNCKKNDIPLEDIIMGINKYRMMQTKTSTRFLEYFYDIYKDLEDYKKL